MSGCDRRLFLKSTGIALVAGGFLPRVFVRMASASEPGASKRTLVVIFQRGAVDGLNVLVPYGESAYYAARPTIAVPRPGSSGRPAHDLDGFFGLHPSLEALVPHFRDRSAAFVHAVGSPDATRSHFDAQDFMESGTPGVKTTRDGFLARALAGLPEKEPSPLRAVAISPAMPRILAGASGAVAMRNLTDFGLRGVADRERTAKTFEAMYDDTVAGTLRSTARESFDALRAVKNAGPSDLPPENGAVYPRGPLDAALRQIAQLIRSGVGLEVAFTDVGGWDTHAGEGGSEGQLANRLRDFGDAIAAFARDLGSRMADVTLVTLSEFGRTARENGNRGTDHGHANVMLLLGGGVRGGRVYGAWPGLAPDRLYEGRDLAVTTDFRDVFAEVLTTRMGVTNLAAVFPGYPCDPRKRPGILV
ncbi:MAG TPA: DUF1501 domain-containing protein [Thermoanaerobaculia bacterium]|nr:DUF1501 domain-containing protein [Thermoanaerobaculia bacterium]